MNSHTSTFIRWELAQAHESDGRLTHQWRNDPQTREMSFNKNIQTWEEYYPKYLNRCFSSPDLPPLFVLDSNQRVAFLFFESHNHPTNKYKKCCEISINLAPEFRGKGLGEIILKEVQSLIAERGYDTILAQVLARNEASKKVFERAGFKKIATEVKRGEEVLIYTCDVKSSPSKLNDSVFIIAEAGSNWRVGDTKSDIAQGKALIEAAAEAGADAIKFQTYRSDTIYVKNAGKSDYLSDAGISDDIHSIMDNLSMPYELIPIFAEHAKKHGLAFMSTPFSERDFDEVDPFVSIHKIASYEITHLRLIEKAAKSGKPVLLSTGAATIDEINWAVNYFKSCGGKELILLQCTAAYPAPPQHMNLATIPFLRERFKVQVGLSDHSLDPIYAPLAAAALGAVAIEKHFTLDRNLPGPDHFFAITPLELKEMVKAVRTAHEMLGMQVKDVDPIEKELQSFAKRGLQALRDIQVGEKLQENVNVAILRPGKQLLGMHPKNLLHLEGKYFVRPVNQGVGIQPEDIEDDRPKL